MNCEMPGCRDAAKRQVNGKSWCNGHAMIADVGLEYEEDLGVIARKLGANEEEVRAFAARKRLRVN